METIVVGEDVEVLGRALINAGVPAINHVQPGIIATYDKYRYEAEVGAAIAQWAEHVTAVVQGRKSKVVPLRSA